MLNKKKPNIFLLILATIIICTPVVAFLSFAQEEKIRNFTDKVAHQLIDTMTNANETNEQKRKDVKGVIESSFDVPWMSRFALGISYKQLSDTQKKSFASLYLNYLVNNYFPILSKYDKDDSYEITKIQQLDNQDYDIKIKLHTKKAEEPISLKYRARTFDHSFKFLDMVVENVSTLSAQRAEFSSIIQRAGIDGLLKRLESSKTSEGGGGGKAWRKF